MSRNEKRHKNSQIIISSNQSSGIAVVSALPSHMKEILYHTIDCQKSFDIPTTDVINWLMPIVHQFTIEIEFHSSLPTTRTLQVKEVRVPCAIHHYRQQAILRHPRLPNGTKNSQYNPQYHHHKRIPTRNPFGCPAEPYLPLWPTSFRVSTSMRWPAITRSHVGPSFRTNKSNRFPT